MSRQRRYLLLGSSFAVIVGLALVIALRIKDRRETDAAVAELERFLQTLDQSEAGSWQEEDLQSLRKKVPAAENGAVFVLDATAALPPGWQDDFEDIVVSRPNKELSAERAEKLADPLRKHGPLVEKARKLRDYPQGRFPPFPLAPDILHKPGDAEQARRISLLLWFDTLHRCHERNYADAWLSAISLLHAGRSLGDEPVLRSQALRMSARFFAVMGMERILGHGTINAPLLKKARQILEDEISCELTAIGLRGERAAQHRFYWSIREATGDLDSLPAHEKKMIAGKTISERTIAKCHLYTLQLLTEAIAAASLRPEKRLEAMSALEVKHGFQVREIPELALARALVPDFPRVARAELRTAQLMLCAAVALAAEEFRLKSQRWPRDMGELVASKLLSGAPIDYFDAQPLRLRLAKDGLVAYSAGHSENDGTKRDDEDAILAFSTDEDIEFRVWNPEHRRKAPRE
jgi:hypothetical protein